MLALSVSALHAGWHGMRGAPSGRPRTRMRPRRSSDSMASAPSSGWPGDITNEHLKVCLDGEDTAALFCSAALRLAQARLPGQEAHAFMLARMTALKKPSGGIRGISAGTTLRRLVGRCLALLIRKDVEAACSPYHYALSLHAGWHGMRRAPLPGGHGRG